MEKRRKIIMLPTKKTVESGDLCLLSNGNLTIAQNVAILTEGSKSATPQYLYLLSNDKIEKDDWVVCGKHVGQVSKIRGNGYLDIDDWLTIEGGGAPLIDHCKKVIASNNPMLTMCSGCRRAKNSDTIYTCSCGAMTLPKFSKDFINDYAERNGSIEGVVVEYEDFEECHNYDGEHLGKDCSCRGGDFRHPLKLNDDNTVILSIPKKKTYTREEVIQLFEDYNDYLYAHQEVELPENYLDNWVDKNLK